MMDEIPERLRRDANNKAPFMDCPTYVDDALDMVPIKTREEVWFSGVDPRAKFAVNPSDSPRETFQDWVPPWK